MKTVTTNKVNTDEDEVTTNEVTTNEASSCNNSEIKSIIINSVVEEPRKKVIEKIIHGTQQTEQKARASGMQWWQDNESAEKLPLSTGLEIYRNNQRKKLEMLENLEGNVTIVDVRQQSYDKENNVRYCVGRLEGLGEIKSILFGKNDLAALMLLGDGINGGSSNDLNPVALLIHETSFRNYYCNGYSPPKPLYYKIEKLLDSNKDYVSWNCFPMK